MDVLICSFEEDILCNDTSGYLVIGGSRFMTGFFGYVGPVRYYRLGTTEVSTKGPRSLLHRQQIQLASHCWRQSWFLLMRCNVIVLWTHKKIGTWNYRHHHLSEIKLYRLKYLLHLQVINPLHPAKTLQELDKAHWECEEVRLVIDEFMDELVVHRDALGNTFLFRKYKSPILFYAVYLKDTIVHKEIIRYCTVRNAVVTQHFNNSTLHMI